MGIDSKHPLYERRQNQWSRCRDTYDGGDSVKAKGEVYLPKLKKQSRESYDAYRQRALFFNAVQRTVLGLTGAVFRIPIMVAGVPDEYQKDITGTGVSLADFVSEMLSEQLLLGRQGILIDHDGTRPYLTGYRSEDITNWFEDSVILQEQVLKVDPLDKYKQEFVTQYRELLIEEGRHLVRLWKEDARGTWKVIEEITPTNRGVALDQLPFVAISSAGLSLTPTTPPLLPLADTNLSHYLTSADLEHGRHFTALPTPYVTGADAESELSIGAETAWILPDPQCKAGFLEFTGQGLKALEAAMTEKRSMMAALGAQLLEGQKTGVEAAETLKLRQNSEQSVLMNALQAVEVGINKALKIMLAWDNGAEPTVTLNRDFSDVSMSPQELTALMGAWQSGGISHDTFLWNLKRGELLPEDRSIDDEKSLIETQGMSLDETV